MRECDKNFRLQGLSKVTTIILNKFVSTVVADIDIGRKNTGHDFC